jgi:hypothetical protein
MAKLSVKAVQALARSIIMSRPGGIRVASLATEIHQLFFGFLTTLRPANGVPKEDN